MYGQSTASLVCTKYTVYGDNDVLLMYNNLNISIAAATVSIKVALFSIATTTTSFCISKCFIYFAISSNTWFNIICLETLLIRCEFAIFTCYLFTLLLCERVHHFLLELLFTL